MVDLQRGMEVVDEAYQHLSPIELLESAKRQAKRHERLGNEGLHLFMHKEAIERADDILLKYYDRGKREVAWNMINALQEAWGKGSISSGTILTRLQAMGLPIELVARGMSSEDHMAGIEQGVNDRVREIYQAYNARGVSGIRAIIEDLQETYADSGGPGDGTAGMILVRLMGQGVPIELSPDL